MSDDIVIKVEKVSRHKLLLATGREREGLSADEAQGLLDDAPPLARRDDKNHGLSNVSNI
jgi:hypothetical protein